MTALRYTFKGKGIKGVLGALGVLLALFILPQFFAGTLSIKEAETLLREYYSRRIGQDFIAQHGTDVKKLDRKDASKLGQDLRNVSKISCESIEVKRGLLVRPFRRGTTFMIKAQREGQAEPEYFRVDRVGLVYPSSAFWWYFRL